MNHSGFKVQPDYLQILQDLMTEIHKINERREAEIQQINERLEYVESVIPEFKYIKDRNQELEYMTDPYSSDGLARCNTDFFEYETQERTEC